MSPLVKKPRILETDTEPEEMAVVPVYHADREGTVNERDSMFMVGEVWCTSVSSLYLSSGI